jgi:hypothetical protein
VELAHPLHDRLARLLVGLDGEGGILSDHLGQGHAQLLLVGLGLGLDGLLDHGDRELHLLQDHRRLQRIAQGVARAGVLEAGQGDDVAGEGFLDVLAVVGVHGQHAAHPLTLVARRVQQAHAGLELARVDAAEGQRAHEGVVHDLEREHGQGLFIEAFRSTSASVL